MPYFFLKIRKDVAKFVVCCSCDWGFKVIYILVTQCQVNASGPLVLAWHFILLNILLFYSSNFKIWQAFS